MRTLAKDRSSGEIVNIEELSMGNIDEIYFALRIELINSMDHTKDIPLILDELDININYIEL